MPRSTADAVKEELGNHYGKRLDGSLPNLDRPLLRASRLVDRVNACATAKGITLTAGELQELETLLAAHFHKDQDLQLTGESRGGRSASYGLQVGMGLERTSWGQSALAMDYSGCLAAISSGKRASSAWLGKAESDQLSYEERN